VHSVDDGFHLVGGVSAASFDLGGILSSRRLAVGAPRGPHTFNLPLLFILLLLLLFIYYATKAAQ